MTSAIWTAWNPPPAPERDLWWAAQRITVPDTADWAGRHQRGHVRLPYEVVGGDTGQHVPAWVCCDPRCGGVELGWSPLETNHSCCGLTCNGKPVFKGQQPEQPGIHRAGLGTVRFRGWYHGPFTPFWEPDGGLRG